MRVASSGWGMGRTSFHLEARAMTQIIALATMVAVTLAAYWIAQAIAP